MSTRSSLLTLAVFAMVLAAPALAAKPSAGTYKGKTSQKLKISIVVTKGAVTELHFKVKNNCGATHKPIDVTGGSTKINSKGHFSMSLGNSSGGLKVSGTFSGTKAAGTLREKTASPLLAQDSCDTGKVHFSVKL